MWTNRVFSLGVMRVVLVAVWIGVLSFPAAAQTTAAMPEAGPTTDLWKFTFTETGSSASPEPYTANVELTQYGDLIYGSVISDRWVGKREKDTLSFTILSQSAKGNLSSQGIPTMSGAFDLRTGDSNLWKGKGYRMAPGAGPQAPFQAFAVTARKLPPNSGEQPFGIDWCDLFPFQSIFNYVYSGIPVHSIQQCSIDKDGDGFYLYGTEAPGGGGSVAAATVYFPWEFSRCHSRQYGFTIEAGDTYQTSAQALQALQNDTAFMNYIHLTQSDINDLATVYELFGDFAVSIGYNSNTKSVNIYISTGSTAQSGLCAAASQSSVMTAIMQQLNKGGGVNLYCGGNIQDADSLQYDLLPTTCATPMLFIYCFGTIHVTYN